MPPHVKTAFEGDSGILAGLGQGNIWIDHSTTDYEQTQSFSNLVKAKGAQILEAPITGGLEALKKGQMTVFIAGDPDLAEMVMPNELPKCELRMRMQTANCELNANFAERLQAM
jgi:3-hydroxyisobutyrate dehydrogenase-like beta-hydroxyacid dehydrogenase